MEIWFDAEFDGNPWPGPLSGGDATAGMAWLGFRGFLGLLEVQLGLYGPVQSESLRAAALVPELRKCDGFWSKSTSVDPFGVARTLLHWRDTLRSAGWQGQKISARLDQLAKVTQEVLPGIPDRLWAVEERLRGGRTDIDSVHLLEDRLHQPYVWQLILQHLEAGGTRIIQSDIPAVKTKGDLAACRSVGFKPVGDGSLQLLHSQGPQAAAEEVAAWLAVGDWKDTVIIGSDPLLDRALRRHGLPTLGSSNRLAGNALLEILPLVAALGWSPADPQRVLELLTLPVSPVPHDIARRLAEALQEQPAIDSDSWREALAEGLESIADLERRERLKDRLDVLLKPTVTANKYPVAELKRRMEALQQWIRGRMEGESGPTDHWDAALGQCLNFQRLAEVSGLPGFSPPQLQRLIEEATAGVAGVVLHPAQAGLHCLSGPGAIAGATNQVVWWEFTRDSATAVDKLPLTGLERRALAGAGMRLPEPAQQAEANNSRWRRPLLCASRRLLLVCPVNGNDGEPQHPHPLWDEIVANVHKDASIGVLVVDRPLFAKPPAMQKHGLLPLPSPRTEWRLPADYAPKRREVESPTAAGVLVGCPLNWVLQYLGKIRGLQAAMLPDVDALVGTVAHELLARVLQQGAMSPNNAQKEGERLFDTEGPRLAAVLFMPGNEPLKARSRTATALAAKALFAHLRDAKLAVVATETTKSTKALGSMLEGRSDLVVGPPPVIVDLKFGGDNFHRKELENGAAFQLACYSYIHRTKGYIPPVAFFIISTQRLLTTKAGLFPAGKVVAGAPPEETWAAFDKAYEARWKELADHLVMAPGQRDDDGELDPPESFLADGQLRVTPPCRFCSFGLLCGHGLEGAQ